MTPVLHVVAGTLDPDTGEVEASCSCGWSADFPSRSRGLRGARGHHRLVLADLADTTDEGAHAVVLLGVQGRVIAACACSWTSRAFRHRELAQERAQKAAAAHLEHVGG